MQQEEQISQPLPPRSSVHLKNKNKKKKVNKIKKWNPLQILVILFVFLILATAYGLYQYGLIKGKSSNRGIPIQTPSLDRTTSESEWVKTQSSQKLATQTPIDQYEGSIPTEKEIKSQEINSIETPKTVVTTQQSDDSTTLSFNSGNLRIHIVQANETLYHICLNYYQSGAFASSLAKYNGLQDINDLKTGFRLKIPPMETLKIIN